MLNQPIATQNHSSLIATLTKVGGSNDTLGFSAETSAFSLTQPPPRSYYRSKFFTAHLGPNSLLNAAGGLLACLTCIQHLGSMTLETLYHELLHEIKAFEAAATRLRYRMETILLSRYFLCATADDVITHSALGKKLGWSEQKLVNTFYGDTETKNHFFTLLAQLMNESARHLDLLELCYICLQFGFKGAYRKNEWGETELNMIVDDLYERIRWQRHEIEPRSNQELFIPSPQPAAAPHIVTSRTAQTTLVPLPFWVILFVVSLLSLMVGFNYWLGHASISIYQSFTHLFNALSLNETGIW